MPHSQPIIVAVFKKVRLELRGQLVEDRRGGDGAIPRDRLREQSEVRSTCNRSNVDRTLVAMGSGIDEDVEIVTGFVQSIEEDADAVPRRWRITIREDDSQHSALVLSFPRP